MGGTQKPIAPCTLPTMPPRRPVVPSTWKCRLLGCIFERVRYDACWVVETCRWCGQRRQMWQENEPQCLRCGQKVRL
jgi:hypothetical protein